jgi:RimJ/RimL family protein N-acetyltransferase/putative flippase GtrA
MMISSSKPDLNPASRLLGQGLRFVTVGAINTLGTLALYQLLLFVLPYMAAYALAWLAGLAFVNLAYPRFVYRKPAVTRRDTALNSAYYLLSFVASWGLLHLFTATAGIQARLSVFLVLALIVPLNFLVTRLIYGPRVRAPRYIKPSKVIGHQLVFRDATASDAGFILELRTDAKKSKFLSATSGDLQKQVAWMQAYASDGSQVYFIIEDRQGNPVGTVRLYDRRGDSFCWGSWLVKEGSPGTYAIESALMVYRFARALGFQRSHFNVRKENESVWRFHQRFGAKKTSETEEDYLFEISSEAIEASLEKYSRFLPHGIEIIR